MKRLLLYSALALVLLYAAREVTYAGVRKCTTGEFGKLRHTFMDANNYDILIIGSSRAESHFHSGIIADSTGLSVYNMGMPGATMPFVKTTLEAYLEKSKAPKYVLLNIDYHVLQDPVDSIYDFPRYFPYISENKTLYKGISEIDPRFPYFRHLAPYSMPYFSARYLNISLRGYTGTPGKYDSTYVSGWSPSDQAPVPVDSCDFPPYVSEAPPEIWKSLAAIDSICRKNNSKLMLILSPLYERQSAAIVNGTDLKQHLRDFATTHHCSLMDYSDGPISENPIYFADPAHLNKTGAVAFSSYFAGMLKSSLQYSP